MEVYNQIYCTFYLAGAGQARVMWKVVEKICEWKRIEKMYKWKKIEKCKWKRPRAQSVSLMFDDLQEVPTVFSLAGNVSVNVSKCREECWSKCQSKYRSECQRMSERVSERISEYPNMLRQY